MRKIEKGQWTFLKLAIVGTISVYSNIYFWLRFGLANAIIDNLRLKIRDVVQGIFNLYLMLISWICQTKSESDLFLYIRNLLNERLKTGYWVQNHPLNLCSKVFNIPFLLLLTVELGSIFYNLKVIDSRKGVVLEDKTWL